MKAIRSAAFLISMALVGCGAGVDGENSQTQEELGQLDQEIATTWTGHHEETHHWENYLRNPCTGNTVDLHIYHRVVGHLSELSTGTYRYTEHNNVELHFAENGVTYDGHANFHVTENSTEKAFVVRNTMSIRANGSDGSRVTISGTGQAVINGAGEMVFEIGDFSATCN